MDVKHANKINAKYVLEVIIWKLVYVNRVQLCKAVYHVSMILIV